MRIIEDQYSSSNFDDRENNSIEILVIHSTHVSFAETVNILCDPAKAVSCHYVIDIDGKIYRLVEDQYRAWHAGESFWRGRNKINDYSIGIELVDVNPENEGITQFTSQQMNSVLELSKHIIKKYSILPYNIVAHSDIAPSRKDDPGQKFDWKWMAENNVGIYPNYQKNNSNEKFLINYKDEGKNVIKVQQLLADYGYLINIDGVYGEKMRDVVIAFKRHFDPRRIDSMVDCKMINILNNIVKQVKDYSEQKQ